LFGNGARLMRVPRVIYEDNHLLVVDKPAGLPTAGVTDRPSVVSWGREYIKRRYDKPGNVFLGVVSRLDSVTSGVLVVARTSKAASRLSDQIRRRRIGKRYLAIIRGSPAPQEGHLVDTLWKDDAAHRMRVAAGPRTAGGQEAELRYRTLWGWRRQGEELSLLAVELLTGRKHQIRVQLAARNWAVIGDRKYGEGAAPVDGGIALHSWLLTLEHPTRREPLRFTADPPAAWRQLLPPRFDWDQIVVNRASD
jgi:23S rRNA pseudouridine1911/1915/1917 synthase